MKMILLIDPCDACIREIIMVNSLKNVCLFNNKVGFFLDGGHYVDKESTIGRGIDKQEAEAKENFNKVLEFLRSTDEELVL